MFKKLRKNMSNETILSDEILRQPGFEMHCSVFEVIENYLDYNYTAKIKSLEIIEVGSGFGLLARLLLCKMRQKFPHVKVIYTGVEVDEARYKIVKNTLNQFSNVRVLHADYFKDIVDLNQNADYTILVSTGLLQSLTYLETVNLLSLKYSRKDFFAVIGFPYVEINRGSAEVRIGNFGTQEYNFNYTLNNLRKISSEIHLKDASLTVIEMNSIPQVLFSYSAEGSK